MSVQFQSKWIGKELDTRSVVKKNVPPIEFPTNMNRFSNYFHNEISQQFSPQKFIVNNS